MEQLKSAPGIVGELGDLAMPVLHSQSSNSSFPMSYSLIIELQSLRLFVQLKVLEHHI